MAISVLIVDDHEGFRTSAHQLLELDGFDVVGEAEDGASAVHLIRTLEPDVVLLDIALPDMSGFDVAERIADETKVILTSSRHSADFGGRVRRSGAVGFIPKDELTGDAMRELLTEAA